MKNHRTRLILGCVALVGLISFIVWNPGNPPQPAAISEAGGTPPLSSQLAAAPDATALDGTVSATAIEPTARIQQLNAALTAIPQPNASAVPEQLARARERRVLLKQLMTEDPAQALACSLSFADYAALPPEIQAQVERPFSLAGQLRVLPVCGTLSRDAAPRPANAPGVVFEVQAEGSNQHWPAYVTGVRATLDTKEGIALQGFELDGQAAVRGEVMQLLAARDAAAARSFFGMTVANADATRDFLTGEAITAEPVTAAAGGRLFLFASAENAGRLNAELAKMEEKPGPRSGSQVLLLAAAASPAFANGFDLGKAWIDVFEQASAWTETKKTVYIIRVDFPDLTGEPVSQAAIESTFDTTVSAQVLAMSYGKTWVESDASPMVVRMPQGTNSYLPSNNGQLHDDAKAAFNALATGVVLANYDIVVVAFKGFGMSSGTLIYAGLAGGGSMWLQGAFDPGVITHELGHNYGIGHAKFWVTSDGSAVGDGTNEEYGDPFDIMGSGPVPQGHFHTQGKSRLNWLTTNQWTVATNSGTYRVYRLDDANTTASTSRGLRLTKAAAPAEYYWLGYRRAFPDKPKLSTSAYLTWQQAAAFDCHLIDTTPGTPDGREDAGVMIGRTYSDTTANLHVTPISSGGSGANEWLDVVVNLGLFPGNRAPDVAVNGPATVAARTPATFTVTGSDPDGDALAYSWNLGEGSLPTNAPSVTRAWTAGGNYSVNVLVSDMKGLVSTQTLAVTVTDPLMQWTAGSVPSLVTMRATTYARGRFVALGTDTAFLSYDGVTWEANSIASNFIARDIAEGNGLFIAAGMTWNFGTSAWEGSLYTSPDGRGWTRATLATGAPLNDVAYGNVAWVAAGDGGRGVRSVDGGVTWTAVNMPDTPPYNTSTIDGLTFGNGLFVAVGSTKVFTSPDGLNWTDRSANTGLASWHSFADAAWLGARLLAGGWYSGVRYSDDCGLTWREADILGDYSYEVKSFLVGDGFALAVANRRVSPDNPPVLLISQDGANWVELNSSLEQDFAALAFGAGRVLGVREAGLTLRSDALYSTNHAPAAGITGPTNAAARAWVTFNATGSDSDGDSVRFIWDFGSGLPLQEGVSISQSWPVGGTYAVTLNATDSRGGLTVVTQTVVVTDPLTVWAARTSGTAASLNDICLGTNGAGVQIALVVGDNSSAFTTALCTSTNGTNWTVASLNQNNSYMRGVIHDGRNFIAVGEDYVWGTTNDWVGVIWTSPDGVNWTRRYQGGGNTTLSDVAANGVTCVAVGEGGLILYSSNHGTNWTAAATTATRDFGGVAWGGGTFVAVGGNGNGSGVQVFTSPNGVAWTDTSSGAGVASWQNFWDVQYCNDRFLASGWYSKLRSSTNGGASFQTTRNRTEEVPAFAYGNGLYFAAGIDKDNLDANVNLISTDGANWTPLTTPDVSRRNAAVFFRDTFITVGDGGTIMQSALVPPSATGWDLFRLQTWPGFPPGSGFTEDYDGDGSPNGLEYALGSDPRNPSSKPVLSGDIAGGYLTLTVSRAAAQPDLLYQVQRSTDLAVWSTDNTVIVTDTATQFVGRSTVQGAATEFLRLKVGRK